MDALSLAEVASLPAVITPAIAARILDVSVSQVRSLCSEGRFQAFKPGRADWRIVTSSLIETYGLEGIVSEIRERIELPVDGGFAGRVFLGDPGRPPVFVAGGRRGTGEVVPVPRAGEGLPENLTVEQVARVFRRSEKTVRRWAREGRIPATKSADLPGAGPKGTWLFPREKVLPLAGTL